MRDDLEVLEDLVFERATIFVARTKAKIAAQDVFAAPHLALPPEQRALLHTQAHQMKVVELTLKARILDLEQRLGVADTD